MKKAKTLQDLIDSLIRDQEGSLKETVKDFWVLMMMSRDFYEISPEQMLEGLNATSATAAGHLKWSYVEIETREELPSSVASAFNTARFVFDMEKGWLIAHLTKSAKQLPTVTCGVENHKALRFAGRLHLFRRTPGTRETALVTHLNSYLTRAQVVVKK